MTAQAQTEIPTALDRTMTRAQALDACARWVARSEAHAKRGDFRLADDAHEESLDLRIAYKL